MSLEVKVSLWKKSSYTYGMGVGKLYRSQLCVCVFLTVLCKALEAKSTLQAQKLVSKNQHLWKND